MNLQPSAGSLRDPQARVWTADQRIFRIFSANGARDWRAFAETGLAEQLVVDGTLPRFWAVEDAALGIEVAPGGAVFEQERIPVISYPYEWSFFSLREAALLHLRLLQRLLDVGFVLKDAAAENVQWTGQPAFIDMGSFVPRTKDGIWVGYAQFCATMLFPLMLTSYLDLPFQPWLRGCPSGITAVEAARLLGLRTVFRRGVLPHVLIQGFLQKLASGQSSAEFSALGLADRQFKALLGRMVRLVESLSYCATSAWSDYGNAPPYSDAERIAKHGAIERWLTNLPHRPAIAWDIGANLGEYARLAAGHCDRVVALEKDWATANRLASNLQAEGVSNVTPLVYDIVNPSPPSGWRNRERMSLEQRAAPDIVLSLAVLHHLCLGEGLRLPDVIDALVALAPLHIIEFVAPEDPMAAWLLGNKGISRPDYTIDVFRSALGTKARIVEEALVGPTRTLFLIEAS